MWGRICATQAMAMVVSMAVMECDGYVGVCAGYDGVWCDRVHFQSWDALDEMRCCCIQGAALRTIGRVQGVCL